MEIKKNGNTLEIRGIIKTISDAEKINNEINSIEDDTIRLKIYESYVLPSSVIGTLLRAVDEGKKIIIGVESDLLEELIKDLRLDSTFNLYKL
jgi:hypothetical protein